MVWIYPQQKYRQIKYAYYDASQKEHFCQPGENWGAFTAQECAHLLPEIIGVTSCKMNEGNIIIDPLLLGNIF